MPGHYPHQNDARIAAMYNDGRTTYEIAAALGITTKPVRMALRRQGVTMRRGGAPKRVFTPEEKAEMVRLYTSGEGVRGIACQFHCRDRHVTHALAEAGVGRRPFGAENRSFTEAEAAEMAAEYAAGMTQAELGRKHGVTHVTIGAWLRRLGAQVRGPDTPRIWTPERTAEAVERYQRGESTTQIAKAMGVAPAGVSYSLHRAGVTLRHSNLRDFPEGWKGGRVKTGNGYVAVRPDEADLHLVRLRANGYVLEHRLVMARHLGRPLLPGETVHHKNGIGDDNRIENLQLRQGLHGRGVKVACLDCGSHNIGYADL